MSDADATPVPDPSKVSARTRLRRAVRGVRKQQAELLESLFGDNYGDFGGSDLFYGLRSREDGEWVPLTVPSDRRHGANWPLWRTEPELDLLRQQARVVAQSNSFARGAILNIVNFVVGDGCAYKCASKKGLKKKEGLDQDEVDGVVADAQDVIDKFLALNHWNGTVDPNGTLQINGSREREIVRRTTIDGEAFVRFFGMEDGTVHVRLVGPEQIRQPGDRTESDGCSYGILHKMEPFEDVEDPQWYNVAYRDASTGQRSQQAEREPTSPTGEWVPADEIIHLKGPDTDSDVKRGTPPLSFDTLGGFTRASKLQRALSMGAMIRACTAEIWQSKTATMGQMQGLAASLGQPTRTGPTGGRPGYRSKMEPGTVRYVGDGMELTNHHDDQTASYVQGVQADLRQAINAFCAPEFFTGDASNADYSSTKEAGSPWSQNAKALQGYYRAAFLRSVWWAIRWAVKCGVLDRRVLEWVDVQVEAPAVVYRDEFERAQTDQILVGMKVKDPQTCSMERGLDPEMVEANFAQLSPQQQPGQGQGGDGGQGGGEQQPPQGGPNEQPPPGEDNPLAGLGEAERETAYQSALDTVALLEYFSGEKKDKRGRRICYQHGKRVPCSKLTGTPHEGKQLADNHRPTVDGLHQHYQALRNGATHVTLQDFAEKLTGLKRDDLRELRKRIGGGTGGLKEVLVHRIREQAAEAAQSMVPKLKDQLAEELGKYVANPFNNLDKHNSRNRILDLSNKLNAIEPGSAAKVEARAPAPAPQPKPAAKASPIDAALAKIPADKPVGMSVLAVGLKGKERQQLAQKIGEMEKAGALERTESGGFPKWRLAGKAGEKAPEVAPAPAAAPAATPAPAKAPAAAAPKPGASPAAHRSAIAKALDAHKGPHNHVSLVKLRAESGLPRAEFDAALHELRKSGAVTLSAIEGRHGSSQEERDASVPGNEPGEAMLGFAAVKDEGALRKALGGEAKAAPAPAAPKAAASPPTFGIARVDEAVKAAKTPGEALKVIADATPLIGSRDQIAGASSGNHIRHYVDSIVASASPAEVKDVAAALGLATAGSRKNIEDDIRASVTDRYGTYMRSFTGDPRDDANAARATLARHGVNPEGATSGATEPVRTATPAARPAAKPAKAPPPAKAKPQPSAPPTERAAKAAEAIRSIHGAATRSTREDIIKEVDRHMGPLSAEEASHVANAIGLPGKFASKAKAVAEVRTAILDRLGAYKRADA